MSLVHGASGAGQPCRTDAPDHDLHCNGCVAMARLDRGVVAEDRKLQDVSYQQQGQPGAGRLLETIWIVAKTINHVNTWSLSRDGRCRAHASRRSWST